jgi:transposase-like protein
VIVVAVPWYLRFNLSYRDIEELLLERGVQADHVSVDRWVQRFTPLLADAARFARHSAGRRWFADETYVRSTAPGATSTAPSTSTARSSTCSCRLAATPAAPAGSSNRAGSRVVGFELRRCRLTAE